MLIVLVVGVEVQISADADPQTRNAASALVGALTAEGISSSLKGYPDVPNPRVIKIAIGKSPGSMQPIESPL